MIQCKKLSCTISLCMMVLLALPAKAQQRFTISGTVKAKKTGETIIGASIRILNQPGGTATNEYGFYSITQPKGSYAVEFSYVGKQSDTVFIELDKDTRLNRALEEASKSMGEVVVTSRARGGRTVSGTQTGVEKLSTREIYRYCWEKETYSKPSSCYPVLNRQAMAMQAFL
jgi:CarboxypepD_reg-like domain